MPKKEGTIRTAVQPHGFENRDQTASHDSFEFEPKKKKKRAHTQRKTKEKETQLLGRTSLFDFASLSKNVSNNPNKKQKPILTTLQEIWV